ncbi:hypothetical protein DPMN_116778 [Dreissena polymorpha]|uniref:BTB domain-containing protein n=2 Tax=Dreissena polymorpha TaxID=45954 RepID=A0A9D4KQG0_DREPO|nr:hypothetical protein DPMN_116778 [Dreissena polymorpha]
MDNSGISTQHLRPDIVNLNVGGKTFLTTKATLISVPDTRLSILSKNSKEYVPELGVYFFDRNPDTFNFVLDFYRTGELHLPKHVCGATIRNELEYWQIASMSIADCCVASLFKFEDELEVSHNLKQQFETTDLEYTSDQLETSKWARIKNVLWEIMDRPKSSRLARGYSVIYMSFVITTCITFILSTHEEFRSSPVDPNNSSRYTEIYQTLLEKHSNSKIALMVGTEMVDSLRILNDCCAMFFTIELVLRIIVCPNRKAFFKFWLNIIDIIVVISMMITFGLRNIEHMVTNDQLLWFYLFIRGMIILRLLRLFRFARHFSGLKILYLVLKASIQELGLLGLTFTITSALFGGFVYYAEFFHPENFQNVPIGIWWAIVTLTTVGYGDYVPVTTAGYIIGALCAVCGLLLLSMPIAVIATNFNDYYSQNKIREKQLTRKKTVFETIRKLFHFNKTNNKFTTIGAQSTLNTPREAGTSSNTDGIVTISSEINNDPAAIQAVHLRVKNGGHALNLKNGGLNAKSHTNHIAVQPAKKKNEAFKNAVTKSIK